MNEVKQQFKEHLYTVGTAGSFPVLPMTALYEIVRQKADSVTIKISPEADSNEVLRFFMQQGVRINLFNELLPSLNDIFIRLVEGTAAARQFQQLQ